MKEAREGANLYRPAESGTSDFFSWNLFRYLRRFRPSAVRVFVEDDSMGLLAGGYLHPKKTWLLTSGLVGINLWALLTSGRTFPMIASLDTSGMKDVTDVFFELYSRVGRELFLPGDWSESPWRPTGLHPHLIGVKDSCLASQDARLKGLVDRCFSKFLRRLLPDPALTRGLMIESSLAIAPTFASTVAQIYMPGEDWWGHVIPERNYKVVYSHFPHTHSWETMRRAAAHEARHLFQHVMGLFRPGPPGSTLGFWRGEVVDEERVGYRDLPWEVDARAWVDEVLGSRGSSEI
jgi:hypothetical protein